MLLRSIIKSNSHPVTCKSWSLLQLVRLISIRHELEKVFFVKGTTAEIQKRLDDLISGRRNRKTFRIADLGNILKYTVKLNLKLDYVFVAAEMKKCSELMTAKLLSKSFLAMSSNVIGKPRDGQGNTSTEFLLLVAALAPKVRSCREKWGAQDMSTILNGLQHMRSQYKEVSQLVSELPPQLDKCQQVLDGPKLGTALYGLQNLNSAHYEVRQLLAALVPHVAACVQPLDDEHLGNALYGLQNMSSAHEEVLQMVTTLVPHIQSSRQRLSANALAKALYGLQNMSSECKEVLQLVVALTPHVTACIDNFTPQEVSMCLYGLKNLSSNRKEVVLLLDVLLPRVRSCQRSLSPQQISDALYGLQNMSSKRKEVLYMLELLIPHVKACQHSFSPEQAGLAMYGLQNMSVDHKNQQVQQLLAALMPHMQSFQQSLLSPQSLCMSLYGLSDLNYLDCKTLVNGLVATLLDVTTAGKMVHWETRDLSMTVLATNALLQSSVYLEAADEDGGATTTTAAAAWMRDIETLRRSLSSQLSKRERTTIVCKSEIDVVRTAQKLFSAGRLSVDPTLRTMKVQVLSNTWLHGFETYLVLKISGAYSGRTVPLAVVNVEVEDGEINYNLRSKRVRRLRDECMRREGVQVHRWPEQLLNRSSIVKDRLWGLVNNIIIQSVTRDLADI